MSAWRILGLVSGVLLGLAAHPDTAVAQKPGGSLVIVTTPEPASITNAFNSHTTITEVATKIYEGLLEYDERSAPKPGLATEWSTSEDGKVITFRLRPGVKWHDGKPFTSADVKFSLTEIIKPFHPRGMGNFAALKAVEAPDELTVNLVLEHPFPAMMKAFSSLDAPIVAKHIYEGTDYRSNPSNNKPVGTGPWVFKEWQRGSALILEKNPNYWRENRPYLDRIIFRFINDPSTRAAALESGEVHVATFGSIAGTEMRRLEEAGVAYVPDGGYQFLAPMMKLTFNVKEPPFNDKRVRQAIAYAIDRKFIADKIFYGFGIPAVGPISSAYKPAGLYTDDVIRFDVPDRIKRAEALLDEAGLKLQSGTRFEMTHDVGTGGEEYRRMGEYIKQALGRIGIKVTLRNEDLASFIRRTSQTYDYHMVSTSWIGLGDPTLGVGPKFVTSNIRPGVPYTNIARYSDPLVDELWAKAGTEIDPSKRTEIFKQIQKKIVEDSPEVFVFELKQVPIARKEVRNLLHGAFTVQGPMYETWLDR